ncbi:MULTISPECIES: transposase [Candidatus Rhabdochlamydia]|nr:MULTISPECIES: transposase [Rhabdochlamydia]
MSQCLYCEVQNPCPTYSPDLNLIERLWRFMNKKVLNNRY